MVDPSEHQENMHKTLGYFCVGLIYKELCVGRNRESVRGPHDLLWNFRCQLLQKQTLSWGIHYLYESPNCLFFFIISHAALSTNKETNKLAFSVKACSSSFFLLLLFSWVNIYHSCLILSIYNSKKYIGVHIQCTFTVCGGTLQSAGYIPMPT